MSMPFVCALHQCSPFYTFHRLELNAVALKVRMPIKQKKPSKQTKANLLGSFKYCNGNRISVTGWLATVQRVMGVFVARVLAMTSSWIERGLLELLIGSVLVCSWPVVPHDPLSTDMINFYYLC